MKVPKNKIVLFLLVLVVVVVVIVLANLFKNGSYKTFEVVKSDFVRTTEVSGKVVPGQEIDLSFEVTGKISVVNVKIGDEVKQGDILARLNSAEINSEIDEASADLKTAQAKLANISGENQNRITSVKESLINTLKKAYVSADDIVRNTVDVFFEEPDSRQPEFNTALSEYFLRENVSDQRYLIGNTLKDWQIDVDNLDPESVSLDEANKFISKLKEIEEFLALISSGSSFFKPTSDVTEVQIDAYVSSISQARTVIASLIVDINSATELVRAAEAEVPVLEASVNNARATVDRLVAKGDNYIIRAPFDGIITDSDAELGTVVSSGKMVLSMISKKPLEIESFIPEVNIAGIDVGDPAQISLDAFGDDIKFDAIVAQIDPRETVKDGVTTYRIILQFTEFNPEILSGMSASIAIEKDRITNQIVIPRYLITTENGENYANVLKLGKVKKVKVEIGQKDNSGNAIINSGLSIGDKVVISE